MNKSIIYKQWNNFSLHRIHIEFKINNRRTKQEIFLIYFFHRIKSREYSIPDYIYLELFYSE